MRAAIGYQREGGIGEANMARAFRRGLIVKPKLKISIDLHNNVGRMCRPSGHVRREWRVATPMRDQWFNRYYLLVNVTTNATRIVCDCDMHDLY